MLSNSTRKLLWFEITKMLIAVLKNHLLQFWHTFVPYSRVSIMQSDLIYLWHYLVDISHRSIIVWHTVHNHVDKNQVCVRWQSGTVRIHPPLLQQLIDISCLPGPQQQTRCCRFAVSFHIWILRGQLPCVTVPVLWQDADVFSMHQVVHRWRQQFGQFTTERRRHLVTVCELDHIVEHDVAWQRYKPYTTHTTSWKTSLHQGSRSDWLHYHAHMRWTSLDFRTCTAVHKRCRPFPQKLAGKWRKDGSEGCLVSALSFF